MDNGLSIEFLILANHAEIVNGLLYVSGGCWTEHQRVTVLGQPIPNSHLGIALSVLVPWNNTNEQSTIEIRIENEDATEVVFQTSASITTGRHPALSPGADQHAALGLSVDIVFPHAGGYRIVATLNGDNTTMRRWAFRVHDLPAIVASAVQ